MRTQQIGQPVDLPTGAPGRPDRRHRAKRLAALLGVIGLMGAAGYLASVPLAGAPSAAGVPTGPLIGRPAPEFVAVDGSPLLVGLDGAPITLRGFAGHPLWITFWATWCVPCQEEAEDIRAAYHAHRGDGLEVLAIDVQEPATAVRTYATGHELDYTIGLDPSAAVRTLYGGIGLPSHVFIDGNGVIRDRAVGQLTAELMASHLQVILGR